MSGEFKLVDVSHTVEHGMITYKGLPVPVMSDHLSREDSRRLALNSSKPYLRLRNHDESVN